MAIEISPRLADAIELMKQGHTTPQAMHLVNGLSRDNNRNALNRLTKLGLVRRGGWVNGRNHKHGAAYEYVEGGYTVQAPPDRTYKEKSISYAALDAFLARPA